MRTFKSFIASALATAIALLPTVALAQQPIVILRDVDSVSAVASTTTDSVCVLVKYVGTTAGIATVQVAAGGDVTFNLAGAADTTTGSPNLDGIYDLSTPAAAVDTMGEFVNIINRTGSNWRAVLVGCLASDLTNNTLNTLAEIDATSPLGVALYRDAAVASATAIFSAQSLLVPSNAETNIGFWLSTSVGPTGARVNPDPFGNYQVFVQSAREQITSAGTIGLFALLGVRRTYSSTGQVTEVVRTLWSRTGAATTVEQVNDFTSGPIVAGRGEMVIVRQRTDTGLTAVSLGAGGFLVRRP